VISNPRFIQPPTGASGSFVAYAVSAGGIAVVGASTTVR
jgi:hypothetical protein